jgi:membrane protein YqaA with SNARE-associated domain
MDAWLTPELGLYGLFASAFLSATLLPGGSEALLFALLKLYPESLWPALVVASVGNTLGALTTFLIGRALPERDVADPAKQRALERLRRHGPPLLLLSWLPGVGDLFCLVAGWMRIGWLPAAAYIATGKFLRYLAVAFVSFAI